MAVGPNRPQVIGLLLKQYDIDVILSDDGLQHYALQRDIEIAVVNGERRFGNGYCLPAGPLREKPSRLNDVDIVVSNGKGEKRQHIMRVNNLLALNIQTTEIQELTAFPFPKVHAVAGVGYPQPFFDSLQAAGLEIQPHEFPDHYQYKESDIEFGDNLPVLMTEKDAVKCIRFANPRLWCVPANVELGDAFARRVLMLLNKVSPGISPSNSVST